MFAAVWLLYREGVKIKPQYPPLVGQLITGEREHSDVVFLWPLDWVHNTAGPQAPLRILWRPSILRIGPSDMLMSGLEAVTSGRTRSWHGQKWLCDILTPQTAREYFAWEGRRLGEVAGAERAA